MNLLARDKILVTVLMLALLVLALAWLSPAERTLGRAVKLVYVHAALMWVAFLMYGVAAILSVAYLIGHRPGAYHWAGAAIRTGLLFLIVTGLLGLVTAKITWGGVYWSEPRLLMLAQIMLASIVTLLLGAFVDSRAIRAGLLVALAGASWWLLVRTTRVIHPVSPIFSSTAFSIRLFPVLLALVVLLIGVQIARFWQVSQG